MTASSNWYEAKTQWTGLSACHRGYLAEPADDPQLSRRPAAECWGAPASLTPERTPRILRSSVPVPRCRERQTCPRDALADLVAYSLVTRDAEGLRSFPGASPWCRSVARVGRPNGQRRSYRAADGNYGLDSRAFAGLDQSDVRSVAARR